MLSAGGWSCDMGSRKSAINTDDDGPPGSIAHEPSRYSNSENQSYNQLRYYYKSFISFFKFMWHKKGSVFFWCDKKVDKQNPWPW